MAKFMISLLVTLATTVSAWAVSPAAVLEGGFATQSFNVETALKTILDDTYQIGTEWGKKPVTEEVLNSDVNFRRMATATARVRGGGTGFYLGKYNGLHLMATNHHVCEDNMVCSAQNAISFELLGRRYTQKRYIGTWNDIDLAILAIEVPAADEAILAEVASPFAFDKDVTHGEPLVTIGFGIGSNPGRVMVGNRDSDCIVYSKDGEYRHMRDPDDLNPGPDLVWSFANGCDVSHGDSGSAMMDRNTGEVVGIIWTGRIPKDPIVRDPAYLSRILSEQSEDVWKQLSYAVPAKMMKQVLMQQLSEKKIVGEDALTLQALLGID